MLPEKLSCPLLDLAATKQFVLRLLPEMVGAAHGDALQELLTIYQETVLDHLIQLEGVRLFLRHSSTNLTSPRLRQALLDRDSLLERYPIPSPVRDAHLLPIACDLKNLEIEVVSEARDAAAGLRARYTMDLLSQIAAEDQELMDRFRFVPGLGATPLPPSILHEQPRF